MCDSFNVIGRHRNGTTRMKSLPRIVAVTAVIFAIIHVAIVAIPVVVSGGAGESQAFAAAIFDFPIHWLLGSFAAGRGVLYGSSPTTYMLVFAVGGTVMYAAIGALAGWLLHSIGRVVRAA